MISLSIPKSVELKPRIVVFGVGGAGGNAVNNMIHSGLNGVEFVVANTDAQALALSSADRRIQLGADITQGLGAGMRPEVGQESAEDSLTEIMEQLDGAHMLFIAAGMGGGTGTGAAPVIARAARERGILTVAIVTKPFMFEGTNRMAIAEDGIANLQPNVDTLITIPNQNLFRIATETTTMTDAFGMADEVLYSGVRSVTDLMVVPGIINLDFADVRTIMARMGKAMMGTGEATGDRRAVEAAEAAISNPLLDDVSLRGAQGVLINITGGSDLTLFEVEEAASLIRGQVDEHANIIVGSALDNDLQGIVRVSVVATGVESEDFDAKTAQTSRYDVKTSRGTVTTSVGVGEGKSTEDKDEETIMPAAAQSPVHQQIRQIEDRYQSTPAAHTAEPEIAPLANPTPVAAAPVYTAKPASSSRPQAIKPPSAPAPAPVRRDADGQPSSSVIRGPFGAIFGRRKNAETSTPKPAPKSEFQSRPSTSTQGNGDLFPGSDDAELEIPSFLRRQNR
ncbi:cell division protein FtsZ [Robiginitomaculum antarcticum]|uniref:cell division protein FtsZ n=1 Tax=Robiginitomaculum antarcticum TaxID=437507 RepID=UPI00039CA169|nr:cell division protein FtsZ [Robiginitomaculum antarcticum]